MMYAAIFHTSAFMRSIAESAWAQGISGPANQIGGRNGLFSSFGGGGFDGIVLYLRERIMMVFIPIGILLVVRAGLKMINSQDEGQLETAKRTIASVCVGIMLAYVSNRLVGAFYSPGGPWNPEQGSLILATEITGIINWALVLLVAVAILMIVASGLKAISSFGKEDTAAEIRRTTVGTITGIAIILLTGAVKLTLGLIDGTQPGTAASPNASIIIDKGVRIIQSLLQYLSLAAVAVIIYAGILMVLNFGNEDQYTKAKTLVIRVAIGLVVVLLAGTAVIFIINLIA